MPAIIVSAPTASSRKLGFVSDDPIPGRPCECPQPPHPRSHPAAEPLDEDRGSVLNSGLASPSSPNIFPAEQDAHTGTPPPSGSSSTTVPYQCGWTSASGAGPPAGMTGPAQTLHRTVKLRLRVSVPLPLAAGCPKTIALWCCFRLRGRPAAGYLCRRRPALPQLGAPAAGRPRTGIICGVLYHGPHSSQLVRSVNFLEFVTPKQNSETVVEILWANWFQPPFSIFEFGSF